MLTEVHDLGLPVKYPFQQYKMYLSPCNSPLFWIQFYWILILFHLLPFREDFSQCAFLPSSILNFSVIIYFSYISYKQDLAGF